MIDWLIASTPFPVCRVSFVTPPFCFVQVFSHVVGKHNEREALGTRHIISEDKEIQPDGKVIPILNTL